MNLALGPEYLHPIVYPRVKGQKLRNPYELEAGWNSMADDQVPDHVTRVASGLGRVLNYQQQFRFETFRLIRGDEKTPPTLAYGIVAKKPIRHSAGFLDLGYGGVDLNRVLARGYQYNVSHGYLDPDQGGFNYVVLQGLGFGPFPPVSDIEKHNPAPEYIQEVRFQPFPLATALEERVAAQDARRLLVKIVFPEPREKLESIMTNRRNVWATEREKLIKALTAIDQNRLNQLEEQDRKFLEFLNARPSPFRN